MCACFLEGVFWSSDEFCWGWTATQRRPASHVLQVLTCYSCVNRAAPSPKSQLIKHRIKINWYCYKFFEWHWKSFNDSVGMDKPELSHQNTYFNRLCPQKRQDSLSCILTWPPPDQNLLGEGRVWTEFFLWIWSSEFVEWERWGRKVVLKM